MGEPDHKGWLLSVFFAEDQIIRGVAKMQQAVWRQFFLEAKTLASTRFCESLAVRKCLASSVLSIVASPTQPRAAHMSQNSVETKEHLPNDLMDLIQAIDRLPKDLKEQVQNPLNRVIEYTRRRRRILDLIQEALGQLRLDMKYLMFDLEATKRERDAYKQSLDGE
jgi:hypothetical protein